MRDASSLLTVVGIILLSAFGCSQDTTSGSAASQAAPSNVSVERTVANTSPENVHASKTRPVSVGPSQVVERQAANTTNQQSGADGRDSDEPGNYQELRAEQETDHVHESSPAKDNQRIKIARDDGDDETAPIVIKKKDDLEEVPLNNGRAPTATALPEDQRIVAKPDDAATEPLNNGRIPKTVPDSAELSAKKQNKTEPAKATKKPVVQVRKTLADLPESLQSLDEDSDGQIGLYEWPRKNIKQFKELDKNNDGYLTPVELLASTKKSKTEKETAKATSASNETERSPSTADSSAESAKAVASEKEKE